MRRFLDDLGTKAMGFTKGQRLLKGAGACAPGVVDERFATQHCRRDALLFGAGVGCRHHCDETFGEDGGDVEAFYRVTVSQNAGVQCAVFQPLGDQRRKGFVQMQLYQRISFTISAEYLRQCAQSAGPYKADMKRADLTTADAARLVDVPLDVPQCATRALKECLAGIGKADRPGGAGEEWEPKNFFELTNLLGEGRLRQVEPLRRAAKVQLFCNRDKVAQMPQFNIAIHMQNIIILLNKILDVIKPAGQTTDMDLERSHNLQMGDRECGTNPPEIEIRSLQPGDDATAFRTLNEEWITRYFTLEKKDREVLNDPENTILLKGGHILMAYMDHEAVGCVALVPMGNRIYELSKMAVSPHLRGLGIGRRLLEHAVAGAKAMGAASLFLGSNSKLENAVHLYESVGFQHVPPERLPPNPYTRANVFMEMSL